MDTEAQARGVIAASNSAINTVRRHGRMVMTGAAVGPKISTPSASIAKRPEIVALVSHNFARWLRMLRDSDGGYYWNPAAHAGDTPKYRDLRLIESRDCAGSYEVLLRPAL